MFLLVPATVTAVDLKDSSLDLVEGVGVDHTANPGDTDVRKFVDGVTDGTGTEQVLDFVGADVTTEYASDITAAGGDHHIIGYGGHVHEPAQALVNGEFSFVGNIVGRFA